MLPLCRFKRAWYFDLYREKEKDPFSDSKVLSKQLPHFMYYTKRFRVTFILNLLNPKALKPL